MNDNFLKVTPFNLWQRIFTLTIIFLVALFFNRNSIMDMYIIMGYAHFILSYYYKYFGKKLSLGEYSYLISVLVVFYILSFAFKEYFIIFVTLYAVVHHFYDEIFLLSDKPNIYNVGSFLPFLGMTLFINLDFFNSTNYLQDYGLLIILTSSLYFTFGLISPISRFYVLYVSAITLVSMFLFLIYGAVHPTVFFGCLIIAHYSYWYITMYARFKSQDNKGKLEKYIKLILISNIVIFLLYMVPQNTPIAQNPLYYYVFSPYAFFAWTAWHVTTTIRPEDYKATFKLFWR